MMADTNQHNSNRKNSHGRSTRTTACSVRRVLVVAGVWTMGLVFGIGYATLTSFHVTIDEIKVDTSIRVQSSITSPESESSSISSESTLTTKATNTLHAADGAVKQYNSFLFPQHGCAYQGETGMTHCLFQNLMLNVSKVDCDVGGEQIESVMGRKGDREFPSYEPGAFIVTDKPNPMETSQGKLHYLQDVLNALEVDKKKQDSCEERWSGITMFITRYEYANLYHTSTDWWNTFFSLPPDAEWPVNVVFLDGHSVSPLEPFWSNVFGNVTYVKQIPGTGFVCFDKAIMVPPGYLANIYNSRQKEKTVQQNMTHSFASHVLASYQLDNVQMIPGKVVIIDRKPYVAHPRSKSGSFQRVIDNMDALEARLEKVAGVVAVELAVLVEFTIQTLDFFTYLAYWKGIRHVKIGGVSKSLSNFNLDQIEQTVLEVMQGTF